MDYFSAARRYMMAFVMTTSMFGFLMTEVRRDVKIALGIGGIVMMIFGIVMVARRVPVEREEHRERELEKARELLRKELRRMITEAEREWMQIVGEHLRDQPGALRAELEGAIDSHVRALSQTRDQEQSRIEKQLHGLQDKERRIEEIARRRGEMIGAFDKHCDRIQQAFSDMQRDARRSAPPAPAPSR